MLYYALLQWKNRKLWQIKVKGASRKRGENKILLYRAEGGGGGRIYVFMEQDGFRSKGGNGQ